MYLGSERLVLDVAKYFLTFLVIIAQVQNRGLNMATLMFPEVVWKKCSSFNKTVYAWPSQDNCSDYKYIKKF